MSSNKALAKNTIFLYFRMILSMLVTLYTSRVILNSLGVSDFGLYNVVGGVVTMFSFLNTGMVAATQRFISYELGSGNTNSIARVFSMSIIIHFTLAFLVLFFAETIGLWFLNYRLNITPNRLVAANWVFQFSILAFIVNIISVPYNSLIVAHERMNIYAYVGVLEVFLKLGIAILLKYVYGDKLIIYGILVLIVAVIIRIIYGIYCKRNFTETKFQFFWKRQLFNEMFSFAGWSFVGNMGFVIKGEGINILINLFFGTAINAARGIAYQASGAISGFVGNFQMALNPQIIKKYASGDYNNVKKMVFQGARLSYFLLMIVVIPIYIKADFLLKLWLHNVPNYTELFLRLVLIMSMVDSMAGPITTALQATGKIKIFQIGISIIMFMNLPLGYIWLKYFQGEPYVVMVVAILTSFFALLFRLWLLKQLINLDFFSFFKNVILKNIVITIISFFPVYFLLHFVSKNLFYTILGTIFSVFYILLIIFLIGISKEEYSILKLKILKLFQVKS